MTWQKLSKTVSDYAYKYKVTPSGCWEWIGYHNAGGYGAQTYGSRTDGSRRTILAHRLFYELTYGVIERGQCVLHRCDNPPCVNPEHLFIGTRRDNVLDMQNKGRRVDLKGADRPNAKLNEVIVQEIRQRLKAGEYQSVIATDLGVNQTLISAIKRRKIWSHI